MAALLYLKISTSTNDDIQKFDLFEFPYLGLYTFNQSHGKGQYHNTWEMKPEENLAFSLRLKTQEVHCPQPLFNFHTAVIVRDFLANLTSEQVEIKWPNDIILNKKKVAGILLEKLKIQNTEVYVLGIGLNVLQRDFSNLPKAGSILTQTGKRYELREIAEKLFEFLTAQISQPKDILSQYNSHLFLREKVSVFKLNGKGQNGIIKNADQDGFLWIDLEQDGLQKFFHKEIELLY